MSSLPTISYVSICIGFISFGISLLTLIRVVWGNLSTLVDAPTQVHFSLANLKQALYEERSAVHRASRLAQRRQNIRAQSPTHRKRSSTLEYDGGYNGASTKILQDTIRKLCRDFRKIEKPFLRPELPLAKESWDGHDKSAFDEEVERYRYREEGFTGDYCNMTLGRRWIWLQSKSQVNNLWTGLERLQLRRLARECTEALSDLHLLQHNLRDLKLIQDPPTRRDSTRRRQSSKRRVSDDETDDDEERIHVRRSYADR